MPGKPAFGQAKRKHLKTLEQYVPVVARVHGGNHPEFHEVRKVFDEIRVKIREAAPGTPELDGEFARLREITGDYRVPAGVCETYEAVYGMLADMDRAYHA